MTWHSAPSGAWSTQACETNAPGIRIQGDFRTNHGLEALSSADVTGFDFPERGCRRMHSNGEYPDVWARRGE